MAIAFDAHSNAFSASNTTISGSHTITGTNPILVVWVYYSTLNSITAATFNGVAMTSVGTVTEGSNSIFGAMYVAVAPPTGTHTISITWNGTTANVGYEASSYTGVAQSSPTEAGTTNTATGTTSITTSITTVTNNDWHIEGVLCNNAVSAGTGATLRGTPINGNCVQGDGNVAITPAGSSSMTWTASASNWGVVAFGLKPFSVNSGANFFNFM